MIYFEQYGDLFNIDSKYYLCHCISSDFALGMGIAAEFNKRYNMRKKLFDKCHNYTEWPKAILVDNVFNLVTKEKYWHKPTYKTLETALIDMKNQMIELDIKYLAMPRIGSGLDKLRWCQVSQIIKDVFWDTDVEILVVLR